MGRPPLTKEQTQEVTLHLVKVTQDLILREGLSSVTIRKVAAEAQVNSAILYKYFKDLDELLLFACLDLFRGYVSELERRETEVRNQDPKAFFLCRWEVFSSIAFQYPEPIYHLFFSKHSGKLGEYIRRYYELTLSGDPAIRAFMESTEHFTNLQERNIVVLKEIMGADCPMDNIQLISDLTVACLNMLLREIMAEGSTMDAETAANRMMNACRLLIGMN